MYLENYNYLDIYEFYNHNVGELQNKFIYQLRLLSTL